SPHGVRVTEHERGVKIGRRDLRMQRENPLGAIAAAVRRCFEELVDRSVELERHLLDVLAQLVPRREAVLARDQRLRIVQGGRLARLEKLLRLTFELVEVGTGGELFGCHRASMLNAGGPQAGQHGDSRAVISISRVDSVLRADPHAPRARGNNGDRRYRRQAGGQWLKCIGPGSLAAMTLPLARRIAVSFPALRHRDFTLLWIGQFLSFAGSRMQTAAILWHVSLLAAPARKAIALGLNTLMFQFASVAGPTLAGLVIAGPGIAWVYAVNAVSFLMVIAALLVMRARPRQATAPPPTRITWAAAREGLRFVFAQPIVRSTMLLDFAATFFASATALLPIFAQDILHVGARGYGCLYAAPSVGAAVTGGLGCLLATAVVARREGRLRHYRR